MVVSHMVDTPMDSPTEVERHNPPAPLAASELEQAPPAGAKDSYEASRVLLDWDDTLLPSSWLHAHGLQLGVQPPREVALALTELEAAAARLLAEASALAPVVIVTAAEPGWVERSAATFLPGLLPLLSQVRVVSARGLFASVHGAGAVEASTPTEWKCLALEHELAASPVTHVLSFGDSVAERDAVRCLARSAGAATCCKSFKLLAQPSVEQLQQQIHTICDGLTELFWHPESLDLMLHPL